MAMHAQSFSKKIRGQCELLHHKCSTALPS